MKGLFIFALCATAVYCGRLPVVPAHKPEVRNPVEFVQRVPVVKTEDSHKQPQQRVQRPVAILSQDSDVNPDGSYHNLWESENGIRVWEEGSVKVLNGDEITSVSGKISYADADGNPIVLTYTADENGFQPQGDHLPTAPPVPLSVVRALEYIAAHPYVEEENIKKEHKKEVNYTAGKDVLIPIVEDAY